MMQIYPPKAWYSAFGGSPSLYINDDGYIYTHAEYHKAFGRTPCGQIDFADGKIYGKDYAASFGRTPIGYIRTDDRTQKIYDQLPGIGVHPILYIQNGKIYTADDYFRVFGKTPSGYVKESSPASSPSVSSPKPTSRTAFGGPSPVIGIIAFVIFMIIAILTKLRFPMVAGILVLFVVLIFFLRKVTKFRLRRSGSVWRFFGLLLLGAAIAFGCMIFWMLVEVIIDGIGFGLDFESKETKLLFEHYAMIGSIIVGIASFIGICSATCFEALPKRKIRATKSDGTAIFLQEIPGKNLFICPFCGAKLAVPNHAGKICITCSQCKKILDAVS